MALAIPCSPGPVLSQLVDDLTVIQFGCCVGRLTTLLDNLPLFFHQLRGHILL